MKTTVSEKGQITIPKAIRDSLGIRAGTILEVEEWEEGVVLRKRHENDPIGEWFGKGRPPVGKNVDEYLDFIRG